MALLILHENAVIGEISLIKDTITWLGHPRPPIGDKCTVANLLFWFSKRASPYDISDRLGIPYYGVSFTDNFWICPKNDAMFFDDVHAFSNANIPSNPNCIVLNNNLSIVKPYTPNEYYAFHVARLLGLNTVQYYPFSDKLVSPIQSTLEQSWFTLHDMGCQAKVGREFPAEVANMILFDGIVGNAGRTLSNISVICEPCSQRIYSLAPTYSLHSTFHFVEDMGSIWGKNLAEEVHNIITLSTLESSNLIKHLSQFPNSLRHVLYHNLLQLGLI